MAESKILIEDGFSLLLENGDDLLLESNVLVPLGTDPELPHTGPKVWGG